jgi:hypothetical protein
MVNDKSYNLYLKFDREPLFYKIDDKVDISHLSFILLHICYVLIVKRLKEVFE